MDNLQTLRVLVVDDNAQMRIIIGSVLLAAGVRRIDYAPHGAAALETLRFQPIDVVYSDYEMPFMNGLTFVRAVRSREDALRFLPIIMLTGHADHKHICAARDVGASEFLGKPVTARAILERLNWVIMRPRRFIKSPDYFGPDRRRRPKADYNGPLRRASDLALTIEL